MSVKKGCLIELQEASYRRGARDILRSISLDIGEREIATVIGPNGASKSSLIKMICGVLAPSSGVVKRRSGLRIGYVPQQFHLKSSMPLTVGHFLKLVGTDKAAVEQALGKTGVVQLRKAAMQSLSGGELQRVLLARALLRKPRLLVLDEPAQGVDINGQALLYRLIAAVREEQDCSILMVSHDLHLVMAQTDKVICLNQHICCHGEPEHVSQHPEYLKLFGKQFSDDIAVYTHDHDHHHNIHGDAVDCDTSCQHDV